MAVQFCITGHTSGLGRALLEGCLKSGANVLGLARRRLPEMSGLQQIAIDLSDTSALLALIESGQLFQSASDAEEAVLINNAGTCAPCCVLGKQPTRQTVEAVALNVTAPLLLSDAFVRRFAHVRKTIVHISSGAGRKPYAGWSVYGAGKAALDAHALAVAQESHSDLRILSIAPGVVDTPMQEEIRQGLPENFPPLARFVDLYRQGDLMSPQESAQRILSMIADEGNWTVIDDVRRFS